MTGCVVNNSSTGCLIQYIVISRKCCGGESSTQSTPTLHLDTLCKGTTASGQKTRTQFYARDPMYAISEQWYCTITLISDERKKKEKEKRSKKKARKSEAGVVLKIYAENFMCHRKLSVPFCRRENIIVSCCPMTQYTTPASIDRPRYFHITESISFCFFSLILFSRAELEGTDSQGLFGSVRRSAICWRTRLLLPSCTPPTKRLHRIEESCNMR